MLLGDTISAVSQLGEACSAVLATAGAGSGLKVMRLVSRQLSTAMLSVVQGYTLQLDGRSAGLLNEMALLESTRMSHLRVVVTQDQCGE